MLPLFLTKSIINTGNVIATTIFDVLTGIKLNGTPYTKKNNVGIAKKSSILCLLIDKHIYYSLYRKKIKNKNINFSINFCITYLLLCFMFSKYSSPPTIYVSSCPSKNLVETYSEKRVLFISNTSKKKKQELMI